MYHRKIYSNLIFKGDEDLDTEPYPGSKQQSPVSGGSDGFDPRQGRNFKSGQRQGRNFKSGQRQGRNFKSGCCNSLTLRLRNVLRNFHPNLEITFNRNRNVNGFPSWLSTDRKRAIWHTSKSWCVGDVIELGSNICKLHSLVDARCPSDIRSNTWRYWAGSEFKNVNSGDLTMICRRGSTTYPISLRFVQKLILLFSFRSLQKRDSS